MTICLIISALTAISFIWGKLTLATTAMISMMAFLLTGCLKAEEVLACFSNNTGILIVSMFIVAAGFNKTQFVKNIAVWIGKIAKGNITKVLAGYILIAVLLCQFIQSNLIPFCILSPLLIATVKEMGISPSKVIYSLGITVIITCGTLPLGGGATAAAQMNGYLSANGSTAQMAITDPMLSRIPVLIATVIYAIFIAPRFAPDKPVIAVKDMGVDDIAGKTLNQKPLSAFQEKAGYIIFFGVTIALLFSAQIHMAAWEICVLGAIAMVLTGVLSPKDAVKAMPISIYLLFVGSIAMATALSSTGAGAALGTALAGVAGKTQNQFLIYFLFFIIPYLTTQVMFNMTTMMIFYPIAIQTCLALGANPIGPVIVIQQAAFAAFLTPMATGTVPYFMGLGGYDLKTVLKMGIIPSILICVITVVWNAIVFPLF